MTTIAFAVTPNSSFALGRNYRMAEAAVVQTLKTNDPAHQHKVKMELKAGIMAAILCKPDMALTEAAAYIATVLNKPGKDRTEAEAKAENAARTRISRIMETYNIKNLEPRGGSEAAAKKGKPRKAKGLKRQPGKVSSAPVTQAVYVSPVLKKADDWSKHLSFVTNELGLTLKKAEVHLTKPQAAAYRKALTRFITDIKKIMA